jgi:broad specificity phosphatase PhoE
LVIVRHGESVARPGVIAGGRTNVELSERGVGQGAALGRFLKVGGEKKIKAKDIRIIAHSGMERTAATAAGIAKALTLGRKSLVLKGARERDFGGIDWEHRGQAKTEYPGLFHENEDAIKAFARMPGGESHVALMARFLPDLLRLARVAEERGGTGLLVSHTILMRKLVGVEKS